MPFDPMLCPPGDRSRLALALTGVEGSCGERGETGGCEGVAGERLTPSTLRPSRCGSHMLS